MPAPSDFTLGVKVLRKKCFGSYGCNVTYQVQPKYAGTWSSSVGRSVTVVYEVTGDEDGVQINNFTVSPDGTATVPQSEFATTSSPTATLTAKATSVS